MPKFIKNIIVDMIAVCSKNSFYATFYFKNQQWNSSIAYILRVRGEKRVS